MKCRTDDCHEYEHCIGFVDGYCNIYGVHVNKGNDCPSENEYEEDEE